MSQDKFWEQWAPGGAANAPKSAEGEVPAEGKGGVDDDVLAAWLNSLPPNDPLVPVPSAPAPTPANPAELAAAWPPAAPVDPFAGIQPGAAAPAAADWDLAIDLDPVTAAPAPATVPAAARGPEFDLAGLAGPAPVQDPFAVLDPGAPPPDPSTLFAPAAAAAPAPAPAAAGPAAPGPFGPPPPPAAPPPEALEAPPLKLQVLCGRRTQELNIQGEALIGRPDTTRGIHPEIDLRLDDAVSRRHAKIFVKNGRYVLTDLNSTNGTRHNREWLQAEVEAPLKAGDEIEVGEKTVIRVLEAPEADA